MRIQIVTNQNNFLGFGIILIQLLFDFLCPVHACPAPAHIHLAPPGQGFCKYKMYCRSITFILKIILYNFARFCRNWYSFFFNQLSQLFVPRTPAELADYKTNNKAPEYSPCGPQNRNFFWWYAPTLAQMRF